MNPNTTNYIQLSSNLALGQWRTIAMIIPTTNTYTDPDAVLSPQRYYRLSLAP